jgi:twitching motility protein PilU
LTVTTWPRGFDLHAANSTNEVRLKIKLAQGGDAHTLSQGMDGVELVET